MARVICHGGRDGRADTGHALRVDGEEMVDVSRLHATAGGGGASVGLLGGNVEGSREAASRQGRAYLAVMPCLAALLVIAR